MAHMPNLLLDGINMKANFITHGRKKSTAIVRNHFERHSVKAIAEFNKIDLTIADRATAIKSFIKSFKPFSYD